MKLTERTKPSQEEDLADDNDGASEETGEDLLMIMTEPARRLVRTLLMMMIS